jgi:predicted nucleotidyltransferase
MREDLIRLLEQVAAWADEFLCIEEVWVFGSFARGDHHDGSDIDIGVKLVELRGEPVLLSYQRLHESNREWRLALGQRFGHRIELHGINVGEPDGPALAAVPAARNDPERCVPYKGKVFALVTCPRPVPRSTAARERTEG